MIGDNKYLIIRRILENVGGTPLPGDQETDLLEKYLILLGGSPMPGDHFYNLLRKIVILKGGTPTPGDNEWNLLVKWLQAEGECRACGDSVFDLWRKILALSGSSPVLNGLLNGLTAYWTMNENSPRQDSQNNHDLSEVGTVSAVAGLLGNAADFNNSLSDYLTNSDAVFAAGGGSFALSTWIRANTFVPPFGEGTLFGKLDAPNFNGWDLRITPGPFFALESYDSNSFNNERVVSDVLLVAGTWYHIAASYDGVNGFGHIWVNNQKVSDSHLAATDAATDFEMGRSTVDVSIDETAIWMGRQLSDDDALVLFNSGVPLPFSQYTL